MSFEFFIVFVFCSQFFLARMCETRDDSNLAFIVFEIISWLP